MVFAQTPYDHDLIRKYVVVFGNFFSGMVIKRSINGTTTTDMKVPLTYSPKEKMIVRLRDDPDANRPYSALLPSMAFEFLGMTYDASRHLNTVGRHAVKHPLSENDKNHFKVLYSPVPYDFHFNLYIYAKNVADGNKLIEQIVPLFTPDYTVSVELIAEMNEVRDIPVVLKTVTYQDVYDNDYKTRRVCLWTLPFEMKGYLWGPIRNKPVIKFITLNERIGDETDLSADPSEVVTAQPGLDANGQPTTLVANTIAYTLIDVDDDFGFAVTIASDLTTSNT